jgi:uncharacterized protein (TIGR03790 family)
MIRFRWFIALSVLQVVVWTVPANAQTGENILLVTNAVSQASDEIGTYYSRARTIPGSQILRLPLPIAEEIERRDYDTKIERPIAEWLSANSAQDRILYIVLTKDVPLRIAGTSGQRATVASVDSELTLLYRKLVGLGVQTAGSIKNPLFLGNAPGTPARHFSHRTFDMYLVGRLDGYTTADVKSLIDHGASPAHQGNIVLDGKLELGQSVGNKWLTAAAEALKKLPGWSDRITLDTGQTTLTQQSNVIGFYTWGSNAVMASERRFNHQFVPGAIAAEYVSTDARTFKEPPPDWSINDTKNPFGGSHQSLIGDLIRDGITGVAGHVAEPFLNGTIRPDILFPAYAAGFNLIESFYLAMPFVSWQTVVVGDVLCSPFGPNLPQTTDLNPSIDPTTELPSYFSALRLAVLAAAGAQPEAARWVAKAEVRRAKKDRMGTQQALEQATKLDDAYAPAQLGLAELYDGAGEWDLAIARYRQIIAKNPSHATALNNLAYSLAVHKGDAAAALPLADRAYRASVSDPTISDTLAWVYYLLGKSALAEPIIVMAARQRPDIADIRLHAAFILAATGKPVLALQHLDAATKLNPALQSQTDVQDLRTRLRPPK